MIELPVLPRTRVRGQPGVVPYTNLYIVNGAVVVPVAVVVSSQPSDFSFSRGKESFAGNWKCRRWNRSRSIDCSRRCAAGAII